MLRSLRILLCLLLFSPLVAAAQASDVCATDDRACHKARLDGLWLDYWERVPTAASGLILEAVPPAPGVESATRWRVSARDGVNEVGTGTFVEAAGGRHFLSRQQGAAPDGTPVEATLEWVVGTLEGGASQSRGILGVVITTVIPGRTVTLLRPLTVEPDLAGALRHARPLNLAEVGQRPSQSYSGDQLVPPAYDYFNCLLEPSPIDETCGESYCQCFTDALTTPILSELSCAASAVALVIGCLPANLGTPAAYAACIIGAAGTLFGCTDLLITLANLLEQCRIDADRCYCNNDPLYPHLCGSETISVQVDGLRAGETVKVNGECKEPSAQYGVSNSVVATADHEFFDLLECNTHQRYTIETEPVATPGMPAGQGRRCYPVGPPLVDVDVSTGDEAVVLDCSCQTLEQCLQGRVSLYMKVQGLPAVTPTGVPRVEVRGQLEYNDASGEPASIPIQVVATSDGTYTFEPMAYSGMRVRWQGSSLPPLDCQVSYPVANGSTLPATTPDNVSLLAVEVDCQPCQDPGGCGQVDVQVSVSGSTRPGGVAVQTAVGANVTQSVLSNGTTTVAQGQPGQSYQVVVSQPIKQLGPGSVELCDVAAGDGILPTTSPFLAAEVSCTRETRSLRPNYPPGPPDVGDSLRWPGGCLNAVLICLPGQYARPCPPGVAYPGSDCVEIVARPCYLSCLGGGLSTPLNRDFYSVVQIVGDQEPGSTQVADDHLTVSANASAEHGIQGFVFAIDGDYVGERITGGHTAVSSGAVEIDTSGLSPGLHTLEVYSLDNHPDTPAPAVTTMEFEVRRADPCASDSTGPALTFSPPLGGSPLPLAPLDVYAEATDPNGVQYVQFYVDDEYLSSDGNWPYRFPWSPQPGSHTLKLYSMDGCGNVAEKTQAVTVTDPCGGLPYPEVSITGLTDGAWLPPALYHIEAQATDHSGQGIDRVEFRVGSFTPNIDTTAPWASSGYFLTTEGAVPIEVRAFDGCGRMARRAITIHIDSDSSVCGIDQGPPVVTITSPASGATLPDEPVTISATAVEDTVLYAWALWVDGQPVDTALVGTPTYQWTRELGVGPHTVEVRAADVCFKTGRAATSVTVTTDEETLARPTFAPYPRLLDGPTNPPGPPVLTDRLVDFGAILPGAPGTARTISVLNDGGSDLDVTSAEVTGKGFEVVGGAGPFTVPGHNGEAFVSVRPTGAGDGLVEGTLTLYDGANEIVTSRLRVVVDRIDGNPSRFHSLSDNFESGTLAFWTGTYGTAPLVKKAAALAGEYGLEVSFVGATDQSFVTKTLPAPQPLVRTRFRFDPNSFVLPSGVVQSIAAQVATGVPIAWLQLRAATTGYEARVATRQDDGGTALSPWIALADAPDNLTFDWWSATSASKANGGARLRLGDGATSEVRLVDNDQQRPDRFRLGALWGVVTATEGVIRFDDVVIQYE